MGPRNIVRSVLAAYFVLYACLLIPAHLAQYSADFSDRKVLSERAASCCDVHDSRTCHICLTAGQHAGFWVPPIADADFEAITTILDFSIGCYDCLHVDHIAARAPPRPA